MRRQRNFSKTEEHEERERGEREECANVQMYLHSSVTLCVAITESLPHLTSAYIHTILRRTSVLAQAIKRLTVLFACVYRAA